MPEAVQLIYRALEVSGDKDRYCRRKALYPNVVKHAFLPPDVSCIATNDKSWHCHGLAFRMATYPDASECIFSRLNKLLSLPEELEGWSEELKKWNQQGNHWATKWNKFFEFLWLLQCIEYFANAGHKLAFPVNGQAAAPDIRITTKEGKVVYAECTVFSKWWVNEMFLEDILQSIDHQLSVRRAHNIAYCENQNPFSSKNFSKTLKRVAAHLTPCCLDIVKEKAKEKSPQILLNLNDFQILLEGDGDYQANPDNAHGIPACSRRTFLCEIIKAKEESNNLARSRPNIVLANSLSIDFEKTLFDEQPDCDGFKSCAIDEIWLAACGIDERLQATNRIQKIVRRGHKGSGL